MRRSIRLTDYDWRLFYNIVLSGVLALRLNCSNVYLPHFFAIQFVQPKLFAFLIHVSKLRDILFYFLPLASLLSQSIPEATSMSASVARGLNG
jgi:hypothetical protein